MVRTAVGSFGCQVPRVRIRVVHGAIPTIARGPLGVALGPRELTGHARKQEVQADGDDDVVVE